jgi:hypothetical protein
MRHAGRCLWMFVSEMVRCVFGSEHGFSILTMFLAVTASEADAEEYGCDAGEEEDYEHDHPAVVLGHPDVWLERVDQPLGGNLATM